MIQAIIEKGSPLYQCGEDGIDLDFSPAYWVPSAFTTCSVTDTSVCHLWPILSQIHCLGISYGIKLVARMKEKQAAIINKAER